MPHCLPLAAAALAVACGISPAHAADGSDPRNAVLPAVVVTSTRTEKPVDEAPVRTEVVDRQEITLTRARTLKEALENVPGLLLQEIRGKSGYQLSLQGLGSDQVLVLIDGLPISPSTSSTVDLSQYLLSDVERIEVVKGAASAQYGSSAMGGVVNVITRPATAGFGASALAEVGSRGRQNDSGRSADAALRHLQLVGEGGSETLRGRLSVDRLGDDGFAVDPAGFSRQGDEIMRQQVAGRIDLAPTARSRYFVDASRYDEDDTQRYLYFAPPNRIPQRKTERIGRDRVAGGGNWQTDAGRFDLRGVVERYDTHSDAFSNDVATGDRRSRQSMGHLTAQYDAPAWRSQLWQFGGDLHRETLTQSNNGISELTATGRVERSSRELFAQNDILLGDRWEFVPGVRWQRDSDFGSHWAPKLAVRGRVFDDGEHAVTLRAAIGRGYRVPNLKERHYLFDHSALGYVVVGNPQLLPESSTSLQLGATIAAGSRWSLDVNGYLNRVRDLIQTDMTNVAVVNGVAQYTYRNVARARTSGIETALAWRPLPSLALRAALTLGRARDVDTGSDLTRRPDRVARIGADWFATERSTLSARVRHQSSELIETGDAMRSPAWTTVDVRIQHKLMPGLAVFAAVENLFDRQRDFADPYDFGPLSGRMVLLGVRYATGNRLEF
ncbi:MAG: TonB-dependent receptor plug domain-containing protein [Lautropia sp.]